MNPRSIRRPLAALALAALLLPSGRPASAARCTLDTKPAATLLLPYFEVDLGRADGVTTLVAVGNARAGATLARVTLWTDLAVPTLAFHVYLTGYDVQTFNLRDVFNGSLPRTADPQNDPGDRLSPRGPISEDSSIPECAGVLGAEGGLPAILVDHLRGSHTGRASSLFAGLCSGRRVGEERARGYLTIDVVDRCSLLFPGEPGYFGTGGVAAYDNVLWGDFYGVDKAGAYSQGQSLVPLQASPTAFAGRRTFYRRYVGGSGADGREPLPSRWALRYVDGGAFGGGTDLLFWREGAAAGAPFPCGSSTIPGDWPQIRVSQLTFDEQETFDDGPFCALGVCPPVAIAPYAPAQRLDIPRDVPVSFPFGYLALEVAAQGGGGTAEPVQTWVGSRISAAGLYSVGLEGSPLEPACPARCRESEIDAVPGRLCAKGPLVAGQPVTFEVTPRGCYSSSCTQVIEAGCEV